MVVHLRIYFNDRQQLAPEEDNISLSAISITEMRHKVTKLFQIPGIKILKKSTPSNIWKILWGRSNDYKIHLMIGLKEQNL